MYGDDAAQPNVGVMAKEHLLVCVKRRVAKGHDSHLCRGAASLDVGCYYQHLDDERSEAP